MRSPLNPPDQSHSREEEAAADFIDRLYGEWTTDRQADFEHRLSLDAPFAQAYSAIEASWNALDRHADSAELMSLRAEAIEAVRRANARRWLNVSVFERLRANWQIAASIAVVALSAVVWQLSPYGVHGGDFHTAIGEQRVVELEDHSRIAIDAATRLQVRYTHDARTVRLLSGQAQFSVAKDPTRPFKVIAGDRTIVAVGTVFMVGYAQHDLEVAMVEGKVAVLPTTNYTPSVIAPIMRAANSSSGAASSATIGPQRQDTIYLSAGEELRAVDNGQPTVIAKADIEAAVAWREGKVIFRRTSLTEAVRRMNRYSHLQVQVDDQSLATLNISGVFEAGDTAGFVDAVQRVLPISIEWPNADTVRIKFAPNDPTGTTAPSF